MDSDEALFDALCRGDMRAFDRLYERFERPLLAFIRAQLRDPSDAEDVLHETFMAVLRARGERHEVRSFRAWLYQVARNLCLNRARSQSRAARAHDAVATVVALGPKPETADRSLEVAELTERLRNAVARLPAHLAELYRLRVAGLSYDELATSLGVPVGTVKSRMHDMVTRLEEELR
ncbi:MAG: RNA polymerase sigma factor [Polyangiaceae bacterium]